MPHAATQVANLLLSVRGCPLCQAGQSKGSASQLWDLPYKNRAQTKTSQLFSLSLSTPVNPANKIKLRFVSDARSRRTTSSDWCISWQINKVLDMPNWFISTFSEGSITFWKVWFMRRLCGFHNAEKKEMAVCPFPASHSYSLVATTLVWVGN